MSDVSRAARFLLWTVCPQMRMEATENCTAVTIVAYVHIYTSTGDLRATQLLMDLVQEKTNRIYCGRFPAEYTSAISIYMSSTTRFVILTHIFGQ